MVAHKLDRFAVIGIKYKDIYYKVCFSYENVKPTLCFMSIVVCWVPLFLNFVTQENRENLKNSPKIEPKIYVGFVICEILLELEIKLIIQLNVIAWSECK
jgi:hypothetical protein